MRVQRVWNEVLSDNTVLENSCQGNPMSLKKSILKTSKMTYGPGEFPSSVLRARVL